MRTFEIIDSEREGDPRPCGILMCDQGRSEFRVTMEDWAGPNDVPLAFAPFVERDEREIPSKWVEAWIDERIAPPSRQNIGQVLRAHDLDRYDALELLVSGEGRSSQDGFYIREVTKGYRDATRLGRMLIETRERAGLTQEELAKRSGIRQEAISRLECGEGNPTAKTLERLARSMGLHLRISMV